MTIDELIAELEYYRGQTDGKTPIFICEWDIYGFYYQTEFDPTICFQNGQLALNVEDH